MIKGKCFICGEICDAEHYCHLACAIAYEDYKKVILKELEPLENLEISEEPVSYFPDTGLNDSPKCSDKSKGEPCEPTEDKEADKDVNKIELSASDISKSGDVGSNPTERQSSRDSSSSSGLRYQNDICVNCGKTIEYHWKSPDKEIICVNAKGLMPTKFSRRRRKENDTS
jgi:hypothetical protein